MLKLPVIVTGFFGLVFVHAACTQIAVSSRSLEQYVGLCMGGLKDTFHFSSHVSVTNQLKRQYVPIVGGQSLSGSLLPYKGDCHLQIICSVRTLLRQRKARDQTWCLAGRLM